MRVSGKNTFSQTRRGFTLIELLVVIAIIAILAAILFPVFARARENARRASCQSNLKQIGLGIMQYTQDYDERFPSANQGAFWGSAGITSYLMDDLNPYIKSSQIWKCPSAGAKANPGLATAIANRRSDYGYHYSLLGCQLDYAGWTAPKTASVADIQRPSSLIMAGDMGWMTVDASVPRAGSGNQWFVHLWTTTTYDPAKRDVSAWYEWGIGLVNAPDMPFLGFPQELRGPRNNWGGGGNVNYFESANPRHLDTANFLYIDGHVKARSVPQLYEKGCNDPTSEWCPYAG